MADVCHGNGEQHCCWVDGQQCPFLEVDAVPGRYWSCGLLNELGTWDRVHSDPRYLEQVKPCWERCGVDDCGDFMGLRGGTRQCCFADQFLVVHNVGVSDG